MDRQNNFDDIKEQDAASDEQQHLGLLDVVGIYTSAVNNSNVEEPVFMLAAARRPRDRAMEAADNLARRQREDAIDNLIRREQMRRICSGASAQSRRMLGC